MLDLSNKLKNIPDFVRAHMRENSEFSEVDKFMLTSDDQQKAKEKMVKVLLGEININDFFDNLKVSLPNFEESKLKELALEICYHRLYPLRDYFKGIENIIIALGGKIPEDVPLFSEEYRKRKAEKVKKRPEKENPPPSDATTTIEEPKEMNIVNLPIKEAVEKYPEVLKQFVSARPIKISEFDELVNPTVKNWLKDYIEHLGAGSHSGFQRIDYLFNSENGRRLDQVDRNIINSLLKSYDDGFALPIDTIAKKIILSKVVRDSHLSPEEVNPEIMGNMINLKNKK